MAQELMIFPKQVRDNIYRKVIENNEQYSIS
jgi:hypothetical protein